MDLDEFKKVVYSEMIWCQENKSVLPDDRRGQGFVFFFAPDFEQLATKYFHGIRNDYKRPLDLIFWFNYKKINPKNDYPFVENCVSEAREIIGKRFANYDILKISYEAENIFKEFSISEVDRQNISYPFGGFRTHFYIFNIN